MATPNFSRTPQENKVFLISTLIPLVTIIFGLFLAWLTNHFNGVPGF